MRKILAGFGEGLSGDFGPRFRAIVEIGGEYVEFVLHACGKTGKHPGEYPRKRQFEVANKGVGFQANRVEQFRGVEIIDERAQNVQEFKIPFSFTYRIMNLQHAL